MPTIDQQIDALEKKVEEYHNRLRDLKVRASKQRQKDNTRRKVLYGAAFLISLDSIAEEERKRCLERVEACISRSKDREFLGLQPLLRPSSGNQTTPNESEGVIGELPFGDPSWKKQS